MGKCVPLSFISNHTCKMLMTEFIIMTRKVQEEKYFKRPILAIPMQRKKEIEEKSKPSPYFFSLWPPLSQKMHTYYVYSYTLQIL